MPLPPRRKFGFIALCLCLCGGIALYIARSHWPIARPIGIAADYLVLSQDGKHIAIVGYRLPLSKIAKPVTVAIYDANTLQLEHVIPNLPASVSSSALALSPDFKLMALGYSTMTYDGITTLYCQLRDVETGRTLYSTRKTYALYSDKEFKGFEFSSDGKYLIVSEILANSRPPVDFGVLRVWDVKAGRLYERHIAPSPIYFSSSLTDQKSPMIIVIDAHGNLCARTIVNDGLLWHRKAGDPSGDGVEAIDQILMAPTYHLGIVSTWSDANWFIDLRDGHVLRHFDIKNTSLEMCGFSSDESQFYAATIDGRFLFFDTRTQALIHELKIPQASQQRSVLSKDNQFLFTDSPEGVLARWRL